VLVGFCLMGNFLCCYGKESVIENIDLSELPAYFSTETWKAINLVNAHPYIGGYSRVLMFKENVDIPSNIPQDTIAMQEKDGSLTAYWGKGEKYSFKAEDVLDLTHLMEQTGKKPADPAALFESTDNDLIETITSKCGCTHEEVEKIVAIMDGPVEYIGGLVGQNKKDIQKQTNEGSFAIHPYYEIHPHHGTAVASLIVSKPCKLPCHNEKGFTSKGCDKSEIVVAGVAQCIKMVNALTFEKPSDVEDAIEKLATNLDPLTDQEKWALKRVSRTQAPIRRILNFSIGLDDIEDAKKKDIQNIKKQYETIMASSIKDSDEYFLMQWLIEYIDNDMKWVAPKTNSTTILAKWNNLKRRREAEQQAIDNILKSHDIELEHFVDAMNDNILPKKDRFLVAVSAGNQGKQLEYNKAGLLVKIGRNTNEEDPIIGVAAGCGKNYRELCPWSNYGNTLVDILAPGENIPVIFSDKSSKGTLAKATHVSGTSFSAPLVAGTIALLAQCKPTASPKEIKKAIFESAYKDSNLEAKIIGGKVLDVEKAIGLMCERERAPRPEKPKKMEDVSSPHHEEL